jgi:DNA polymerase
MEASARAAALREAADEAAGCVRCPLAEGRTQVVFGEGNLDADLVLVGEAPGFYEDRDGRPFAGRARELLERLFAAVGLSLDDAYLATVLKCRPPGNRDPLPVEVSACEPYLYRQLELVRPRVVATLGSFATTLLSGRALGITRVHGEEQTVTLGSRTVTLLPLYHPAAALYTPTMLEVLERDVGRLPTLLAPANVASGSSRRPGPPEGRFDLEVEPGAGPAVELAAPRAPQPVQLGLF